MDDVRRSEKKYIRISGELFVCDASSYGKDFSFGGDVEIDVVN
jgi:hypothetical protein